MSEANALKVAICDCLIKINDGLDPVNRNKWGPIIPPTAIDWIGDALVAAVLASRRENVECPICAGRKFVATGMYQYACPVCSAPENVEEPT